MGVRGLGQRRLLPQPPETLRRQQIAFLQRFLGDRDWAIRQIEQFLGLSRPAGLRNRLDYTDPLGIPLGLGVFGNHGPLEVWRSSKPHEFGLAPRTETLQESPYFGVVSIASSAFKKPEHVGIEAEDALALLFDTIDEPDSSIQILIGAKKFIEGWSSWRVSMGL